MEKLHNETHRQFFERLASHVRQHLTRPNVTVDNMTSGATGDEMNITMMNMVVVSWISRINPKLIDIIKHEYATDLKNGIQLYALMPRIAKSVDSLLARHDSMNVGKVDTYDNNLDIYDGDKVTVNRFQQSSRKLNKKNNSANFNCSHCCFLKKVLQLPDLKTNHALESCPRNSGKIRICVNQDDTESGDTIHKETFNHDAHFQKTTPIKTSEFGSNSEDILYNDYDLPQILSSSSTSSNISDLSHPNICKLTEEIKMRISARKSSSPALLAFLGKLKIIPIIDEGAELSVMDAALALKANIPVISTSHSASAAGSSKLNVTGQTRDDIVITSTFGTSTIPIYLGKVIVVPNLGCDMLIGEPAKQDNKIFTIPHLKMINIYYNDNLLQTPYLSKNEQNRHKYRIMRTPLTVCLPPEESIEIDAPEPNSTYQINHRHDMVHWFDPGIVKSDKNGKIKIKNITTLPISLVKNKPIGELRVCSLTDVNTVISESSCLSLQSSTTQVTQTLGSYQTVERSEEETNPLADISIDPDHQFSSDFKEKFTTVCQHYSELFTKRPGSYNNYYGPLDSKIDFISKPPPNNKVYLPAYSDNMLKTLADKMDELIDYGVLIRPESNNMIPKFVSPSMLVPKPECGEYRYVTDFTQLNTYIHKYPATSPTIYDARKSLAKKKYRIEMDLSNFFYQSPMKREDMEYLGVLHPFKGTFVYSREPQGLKNASEHGYNKLAAVYGDMVAEDRLTRMADGVYPLGDTPEELLLNFIEVLQRAKNCGFTFKPSKLIVAPKTSNLFGWILSDSKWSPTEHTMSALTNAPTPVTVKQLRSFCGSFKQFTMCVPRYAEILSKLENLTAGRLSGEKITWTDENLKHFEKAKIAASDVHTISIPNPNDRLTTSSDYCELTRSVAGKLIIERTIEDGSIVKLLGGYFSAILNPLKSRWLPCEGEAAGIKLTINHFAPFIRDSKHQTVHLTDSMPCVHAYKRAKNGAYSSSSRIASFLSSIAELGIEIKHNPGKQMFTTDFQSRNPIQCQNPSKCQICKFVSQQSIMGENASQIRNINIQEIMSGAVNMPFNQRKTWLGIQKSDSVHVKLANLISTGQLPQKKLTGGIHTTIKHLHTMYCKGDLKILKDGLIVVKAEKGCYDGYATSVPSHLYPGIVLALHNKFLHPSKTQLTSLLSRYFYTPGHLKIVNDITDNCLQCNSLKTLPKELFNDTTQETGQFATEFAADVIERAGQKILVVREKLSQYTWVDIIPDLKSSTLRLILLKNIFSWTTPSGAVVRTDQATSFQSLAQECNTPNSLLSKLKVKIELGRVHNLNKNPVAENSCKEIQKEILRLNPAGGPIAPEELLIVQKTTNDRIRNRNYASKEIFLRRDLISNKPIPIDDEMLSKQQHDLRLKQHEYNLKFNSKTRQKSLTCEFKPGDLIFLKSSLSKEHARDLFIVDSIENLNDEPLLVVRKANNQLRQKTYQIKPSEAFLVPNQNQTMSSSFENSEKVEVTTDIPENETDVCLNSRGLPKRKAASRASDHLKEISKFCKISHSSLSQIYSGTVYHKHGFVPLDDDEDTLVETILPTSRLENSDFLGQADPINCPESVSHSTASSPSIPSVPPHSPSSPQSPTSNLVNPRLLSDALQTVVRDMKAFNERHPLPPPYPLRRSSRNLQPLSYNHLHNHGWCKERGRK